MNKETYEALKRIIKYAKDMNILRWKYYNKNSEYYKEITAVESWIDEVAKEYEE